ncbi:hypothetical protein LCGC14_2164770 [marine sediment metagenome]|uniref:Uncharacterized protein n=1 Tax=marine sediment metagenome TaxID=412755 RepID=A0A0F9G4H4_9ZZZZ
MNIKTQVIRYLTKKEMATAKDMARTIPYKAKSIETKCLELEHEGLIFRAQGDEGAAPNLWQKHEGVTVDTPATGELEMSTANSATEKEPQASQEGADLDQKGMFINHLTQIGVAPKAAIPTIAEIFFEGDIESLSWLNHVLLRNAAGFVTGQQRSLIMAWWANTRHLPFDEEDFPVEAATEGKAKKGAKGKAEEEKPARPLDLGLGWKVGKDNDGDWVALPGGAMTYQEAVEAAERRHLIGSYGSPRGEDGGEEADEAEGSRPARRGKREEPLVEKMMLKLMDNMFDGRSNRDSAGDERVERLQEQVNRMNEDRLEDRFERLEGLVAQAVSRDPWEDWEHINKMRERMGVTAPAVTDNSPAVQLIKDSTDKLDRNVGRMVGIMERVVLREGNFAPEDTRSEGERDQKAGELLTTAQDRDRSRGLRKGAFGV